MAIFIFAGYRFLVSHWIFRWRTAMNDYYMARWGKLRHIEGASQRVQDDTMRFAGIMEQLGVQIADAVMTLIAFLPILWALSSYVTELPIVGEIPAPLVTAAIVWSLFGTVLLATVGIRLPGLEFRNQRVEAAYRKELVYGEDDEARAQPITVSKLFSDVRKNYFTLYFHYMYFNLFRSMYLNADNLFGYFLLVPTIVAAATVGFTYGIMQQILSAFGRSRIHSSTWSIPGRRSWNCCPSTSASRPSSRHLKAAICRTSTANGWRFMVRGDARERAAKTDRAQGV